MSALLRLPRVCPPEEGHYYQQVAGVWICCKCGAMQ